MTALSYNFKGKMGDFDYRYFHICMGEFFIFILETFKFLFFFLFFIIRPRHQLIFFYSEYHILGLFRGFLGCVI